MDADLLALVESNKQPDDVQAEHMRVLISSFTSEISVLDLEIESTITLLRELQNRRDTRSKLVAGLKSALSPIRAVPVEILAEIFLMSRDEALAPFNYSLFDSKQPPLVLCHVSSQWRGVCLSDARLWDHIHVHSCTQMPPTATLTEIFKRSRMRPLDIQISQTPLGGLFPVIMGAHNRVQRSALRLTSEDDISDLWSYPRDFPALTYFELHITRKKQAPSMYRPVGLSLFKSAPLLRSFLVWSYPSSFNCSPGAVVWSQLTEMTLDIRIDQLTALSIIVACTHLEDCRICFRPSQPGALLLPAAATTLPHLWRLRVFGREGGEASPFFEGLTLPALTELLLSVQELSPQALPNLYNRSRFRLKTLHFMHSMPFTVDGLAAFLNLTPSLEELALEYFTLEDELFEALTYDRWFATPFELPKLRSLVLRDGQADPERDSDSLAAAEMAESFQRYPGHLNRAFPSLEEVVVMLGGNPFHDHVEKRLMRANGGVFTYERWED
ncbi:hypothetical protein FB45DRAFT_1055905 [Roridomyces roridus]|uniref:F-box domain-containing protein n=1 Tax=Roridomyces roridus TaxID=1738132 RepID=A0AAD7AZP8_9AGAR|nr:hypothetical protein FB45DRAFT_952662 [Roridomyces roridus]KAJ7636533.1 hypothetical protein FB45DRAFT_1055905 [Roridomyces roridus]